MRLDDFNVSSIKTAIVFKMMFIKKKCILYYVLFQKMQLTEWDLLRSYTLIAIKHSDNYAFPGGGHTTTKYFGRMFVARVKSLKARLNGFNIFLTSV